MVTKDYDGLYRGECGDGLSEEQFESWVKQQDKDTQVIIVEVCENITLADGKQEVTFKVENHVGKNTADFLKGYDEIIKISRSAETEIIAKSVETQVLGVDANCGCFSGEQRGEVCINHNEFYAPVLRLPVGDVDRRMLRQILNKLKGKHNKELDAAEYIRIVEAGEKEPLKALLASMGERLPEELEDHKFPTTIPATYEIIVECNNEQYQRQTFEKLKSEGYKLRILTL